MHLVNIHSSLQSLQKPHIFCLHHASFLLMANTNMNCCCVLLQLLKLVTKTSATSSVNAQAVRFAAQQVEPSRMEKSM
jgi:hypothetical protein